MENIVSFGENTAFNTGLKKQQLIENAWDL